MKRTSPLLAALLLHPACISLSAAEFIGAEAVLNQVKKKLEAEAPKKEASPVDLLVGKITAYQKESVSLPEAEAASRWLALLDGFLLIPQEMLYQGDYAERLSLEKLLQALPPPKAWDALAKAIAARPEGDSPLRQQSLVLFSTVLRDDSKARQESLRRLKEIAETSPKIQSYERDYLQQSIKRLGEMMDVASGDAKSQLAAFAAAIAERKKESRDSYRGDLNIPDLLQDADEAVVAPLIKEALSLDVEISVEGKTTRRLAARLALENLAQLKKPVWDLVETESDLPLYEELAKKFPQDSSYNRQKADTVYLLHLIAAGRTDEATRMTLELGRSEGERKLSISVSGIESMQKQGFGQQMHGFLSRLLAEQPDLPLWDAFITLSAQQGEPRQALEMLQKAIARPDLKGEPKAEIEANLVSALLAADQVEEGLKLLQARIQNVPKPEAQKKDANALAKAGVDLTPEQLIQLEKMNNRSQESPEEKTIKLGLQLTRLGRLLNRPELVDQGVKSVLAAYERLPQDSRLSQQESIVRLLVECGRGPEAEALLLNELTLAARMDDQRRRGTRHAQQICMALTWVYYKAGRYADIVLLLDQSPYWRAKDLAFLMGERFGEPLPLMAAKALAEAGRKDDARRIVLRALPGHVSEDALYALLVSLGAEDLVARLDALQAAHRFEERPLIWKARWQLDQGRPEEAEKTIRAAIAIDPSDGEQGKGDRMRAYSVLADILDKKGDAEQAKIMRGAVQAIRISEDADDWWNAGLLSRAVTMYEQALTHFADAYCIQSRLALRYSEMGDFAKAEVHYQRAFELMPDSFGRVESHCFGCEGAFKGKRAQNIAEKVFTQLAEKMPDKAQVFYLLGYLRDQQRRPAEAAELYRRAVKLDPDYLNAWKKLLGTAEQVSMPKAEREKISLALFRLDQDNIRALSAVSDLRLFWNAILAAEAARLKPETGPVYALPVSADALAKDPDALREAAYYERRATSNEGYRAYLTQHPLIQAGGQVLQVTSQRAF